MRHFFKSLIVRVLTWEARHVLLRRHPFIIAVTGSVGKTSTKDAIYHVLRNSTPTRKSQKSFNSELGIPLTVLGLSNAWNNPFGWMVNIIKGFVLSILPYTYPKLLVLEVGADHPGDIKNVTKWVKPDIAVITRLPDRPVHVENFASPEEVAKEKAELVKALSANGVFVANADDPLVLGLMGTTRARMFTYGFSESAQVRGSYPQVEYEEKNGVRMPIGILFRVDWQGSSVPVRLPGVLGIQPCMAALAALAVGIVRGEPLLPMAEALSTLETPQGRMRILEGKNNTVIIDDTYNASPVATEAALDTLRTLSGGRKIAALGDMLELGKYSEEEHERIGTVAGKFVDELVLVGKRAKGIGEGAKNAGLDAAYIHYFENSLEAGKWLAGQIHDGDIILAKGSQGSGEQMIRMERAVKELLMHPDKAPHLLVRQEKEWLKQYQ